MERDTLPSLPGRRSLLRAVGAGIALSVLPGKPGWAGANPLRIGLTPVFLDDQVSFVARWRTWLEQRLGRPVNFVQRGNYRDIVDLLRQGKLDFAWICGYPYVRHRADFKLVAVPLWRGQPTYRAYLIVPRGDTASRGILDLRGRVFAYADPDSNSGFLYPQYLLTKAREGKTPFFGRTFFTWAHRKVVEAVAIGLAAGGAVDGYVWEVMDELFPALTRDTRVMHRSEPFGYPPFVARADLPEAEVEAFRRALMGMAADASGAALLGRIRLDGFTLAGPGLYDGIDRMRRILPARS